MSTDSDASLDFQLFLACRAGDGADSALIAAALSATHGGAVVALSDGPNQGSTFIVTLPLLG